MKESNSADIKGFQSNFFILMTDGMVIVSDRVDDAFGAISEHVIKSIKGNELYLSGRCEVEIDVTVRVSKDD